MRRIKEYFKKQSEKMQDIEYVKRLYRRTSNEMLVLILAFALFFYFNYNYVLFKLKMATEFVYTNALDDLSNEHLGKDFSVRDMDALTIALYGDALKDEDKFFRLYRQGEFKNELDEMEDMGGDTRVYTSKAGAGVISFTLFSPQALKNVKDRLSLLKGCDTVIIDLRGNTGGMVGTAEGFASLFLEKGDTIYSYASKSGYKTVKNRKTPQLTPQKIIILQDEMTASASEIFIMALRENLDNVEIIGTVSYGKGVGQNEYFLTGGYGFKFTSMKLFTPSGASINGSGIVPDTVCEDGSIQAEMLKE